MEVDLPPRGANSDPLSLLPENLRTGLQLSKLPALDGLRAVAAFLVVFSHIGIYYMPGGLGVLMFFVLSGFLITWLLLKEDEKTGDISLTNFYFRRSLRIFPAFYCYFLLYLGLMLSLHKRIVWGQAISALFYVNNYYQAIHGDPNTGLSHTWSLGIEEQFYLLWASAFLLLRKRRERLAWVLLIVIVAIWIHREVLHFAFGVWQGYIYEAFDTRADHLLIGCLLAVALRSGFLAKFWKAICSHWLVGIAITFLLMVSTAMQIHFGLAYRDTVAISAEPVLVALLIVQLIAFRGTILWAWLNFAWVRYLGRISYSTYLYQQIVMEPVRKHLARFPFAIQLAIAVALVVLLASMSYYFVEKPFLNLKDRYRGNQQNPT